MKFSLFLVFSMTLSSGLFAVDSSRMDLEELKTELIARASKYTGLGDPDFKIQNELEPIVNRILALNPQPPVKDRLELLYGVWKQVWGPYDYRNNKSRPQTQTLGLGPDLTLWGPFYYHADRADYRGVDPTIGVREIYQYIDIDGFYYNVSPSYKKGDRSREKINYLKGQYRISKTDPTALNVRFVKFLGMSKRPEARPIFDFVNEAEAGTLPNQITVVPTPIVRLFFGGGSLKEVYTDENLRILYGSNNSQFKEKYLYIMVRP